MLGSGFAGAFGSGFAFLLTPLGAFLEAFVLGRKACQRFLDLLGYVFVADIIMQLSHGTLGGAFRVFVLGVFASGASLTATLAIAVTVGSRWRIGARSFIDVHFLAARLDAAAFLAVSAGILSTGILSPTLAFFSWGAWTD